MGNRAVRICATKMRAHNCDMRKKAIRRVMIPVVGWLDFIGTLSACRCRCKRDPRGDAIRTLVRKVSRLRLFGDGFTEAIPNVSIGQNI